MKETMIRTVDLRVDYGLMTAVDHVNLEVQAGEIYGLIGPNGAGKTSTMRVLATLLEPTYGEVYIAGIDALESREEVHQHLGYMPDFAPVYDDLTVNSFLKLFARAYNTPRGRVEEVLEMVDLTSRRKERAGSLSRGLQQRLVLGKTLLHDPDVMLLDEPASGLDPLARVDLREILQRQASLGKTILISSHILSELSGFCSSFGIMASGKLHFSGGIDALRSFLKKPRKHMINLTSPCPQLSDMIAQHPHTTLLEHLPLQATIEIDGPDEVAVSLLSRLIQGNAAVKSFYEVHADIEEVFLHIGREDRERKKLQK